MIELATMPSLPGVTFKVAENEEERQAYFTIRAAAYDEDARFPRGAGAETEADSGSVIIIAREEAVILGGARLRLARNQGELFLDKYLPDFQQRLPAGVVYGADCAEYGMLALIPSRRNTQVTLGLYLYSETVCRTHHVRHVFFVTERARARLYHRAYKAAYGGAPPPRRSLRRFASSTPPTRRGALSGRSLSVSSPFTTQEARQR